MEMTGSRKMAKAKTKKEMAAAIGKDKKIRSFGIKRTYPTQRELKEMTGSRKMADAKDKKVREEAFARMAAKRKKKKSPVTGILEGQGY